MNIFLWVLQIALAWFCIAGGIYQIFKIDDLKKGVASMRALPRSLWAFFGAFSCLAGLCLILPGAINMLPIITAYAAAAICAESVLISALYIYYRDFAPLNFTLGMAIVAGFISYGRFVLNPF